MSEIVVTSTTDTPEAVAQALGVEADEIEDEIPATEPEVPAPDESGEPESGSASGADEEQDSEAQDDEPEPEDEDEEEPVAPPTKKKGGWQKKIDKLTRLNYEKDQELATLKARLTAPAAEKKVEEKVETKPDVTAIKFPVAPDPAEKNADGSPKYQTYGDFLNALTSWTKEMATLATTEAQKTALAGAESKVSEMKKELEKQQDIQRKIKDIDDAYQSRRSEAKPLYSDWDTVVDKATIEITPTMVVIMQTHPMGAHLAYWYGKNPDEVARIAQLHPEAQKLELGYIIKTLKIPAKSTTTVTVGGERKKSLAPKPMKTAAARPSAAVKDYKYYENVPYEEFKKARETGALK